MVRVVHYSQTRSWNTRFRVLLLLNADSASPSNYTASRLHVIRRSLADKHRLAWTGNQNATTSPRTSTDTLIISVSTASVATVQPTTTTVPTHLGFTHESIYRCASWFCRYGRYEVCNWKLARTHLLLEERSFQGHDLRQTLNTLAFLGGCWVLDWVPCS